MKSFYEMSVLLQQEGFSKGFLAGTALGLPALLAAPAGIHHLIQQNHPIQQKSLIQQINPSHESQEIGEYLGKHEGFREKAYDDGKGYATIGIGHRMAPNDQSLFVKLFGNKYDFPRLMNGTQKMEREDILQLFDHDYISHRTRTKTLFPKFDTYPVYIKAALIDGVYRGDLAGSPKTRALINSGQWREAAQEYLDNREYQNTRNNHMAGVANRMEENQKRFLRYANELAAAK